MSSGGRGRRRTVVAAHAKINLVLELLGPRDDGYTDIETVYQTVGLADRLEVSVDEAEEGSAGEATLAVRGEPPCEPEENLALLAARAYVAAAGSRARVHVALEKAIPCGAGLGGGSSDAAAVLRALDRLHDEPLGPERLAELASGLGADVAYFLVGGLVLGRGRGDELTPLGDVPPRPVVLARSGPPLSTADVYRLARRGLTPRTDAPKIARFLRHVREAPGRMPPVFNGLQSAAECLHPRVGRLLERLAASGGCACMSGSGSAVFGLFDDVATARGAAARLAEAEPDAWIDVTRTVPRRESHGGVGVTADARGR